MTTKNDIMSVLKEVYDPELGVNIVDLGLVYGLDWDKDQGRVHVDLTLTSPGCPLGPQIIRDLKQELSELQEIVDIDVDLVWSPLWHPSMMSDEAKEEMGYDEELGIGLGYF